MSDILCGQTASAMHQVVRTDSDYNYVVLAFPNRFALYSYTDTPGPAQALEFIQTVEGSQEIVGLSYDSVPAWKLLHALDQQSKSI